jgi:hypothetical protein
VELAAFLIFAAVFGAIVLSPLIRKVHSGSAAGHLLIAAVLVVFGFVGFKAGFVRPPEHTDISWGVLAIAGAAYTAVMAETKLRWFIAAMSAVSLVIAFELPQGVTGLAIPQTITERLQVIGFSLTQLSDLALNPWGWLRAQEANMEQGRATVRAAIPLPHLAGSVDILPSMQSGVIAAGLQYRPRFAVQDYIGYRSALINENHRSWFGPRSPDFILFALGPIDGRLPALSEGALWPDLLRYYEPFQRTDGFAVLRRRRVVSPPLLSNSVTRVVRLGDWFELGVDPIFLALDVRPNAFGMALDVLFKPPAVNLRIRFEDDSETVYRIIPEIARAGFVASPFVQTADDYLEFALGESSSIRTNKRPIAAAVEVSPIGSFAFSEKVIITTRTIDIISLRRAQAEAPEAQRIRRDLAAIDRILAGTSLDPPYVDRIPEGVLVHAPRKTVIRTDGAQSATVRFGIRDGAWTVGKTSGACFRASSESGSVLWERCLDPQRREEDRGLQTATFALTGNDARVVLETLCRADCAWAWTYWAGFEPKT